MSATLRPQAISTRDIARVKGQIAELLIQVGILEQAAMGRVPWGFLNQRERRGWLNEVEVACNEVDEVRRRVLVAARTAVEEDAA
jgi:hypothetical protein